MFNISCDGEQRVLEKEKGVKLKAPIEINRVVVRLKWSIAHSLIRTLKRLISPFNVYLKCYRISKLVAFYRSPASLTIDFVWRFSKQKEK